MVKRPPDSEDPTSEEEALEFDGTHTDQLDETYRVVAASESANGAVGFDDRGNSHWKWKTEVGPRGGDASETFDQLEALDNPALSLEKEAAEPQPPTKRGYDPYATDALVKPKAGR